MTSIRHFRGTQQTTVDEGEDLDRSPKEGYIYTSIILTLLNIFNYCDRYIPSSTKDLIKGEWNLTDEETGRPALVFLLAYMVASPVFATIIDRGFSRKIMLAFGITIWSISSAAAFFAQNFGWFLFSRMGVGFGEAVFVTVAYVLLTDYYPPEKRNMILGIFYAAGPIGAAIGFMLGGTLGQTYGWREAYLFTGAPGIALALLVIFIKDPGQGAWEEEFDQESLLKTLKSLVNNNIYVIILMSSWFSTFGVGAMADWLPTYFSRTIPINITTSALIMGAVTVVSGIGGSLLGSALNQYLHKWIPHPNFLVCSIGSLLSCLLAFIAILTHQLVLSSVFILLSELCLFVYNGPSSAALANCVHPGIRARSFAILIFVSHLGDAVSPMIVGWISDRTGSLTLGICLVPVSFFFGGLVYAFGFFFFREEIKRGPSPTPTE